MNRKYIVIGSTNINTLCKTLNFEAFSIIWNRRNAKHRGRNKTSNTFSVTFVKKKN